MSENNSPWPPEFWRLVECASDEPISTEEAEALAALLAQNPAAQRDYLAHIQLQADIHLLGRSQRSLEKALARLENQLRQPASSCVPPTAPTSPNALGFIENCFQMGSTFVAKPFVLVLVAAGLLASVLLIVVPMMNRQPAEEKPANPIADGTKNPEKELVVIARITDSHSALWQDGVVLPVGQSLLAVGQKLSLVSGLVEISFDNGASVLLEGPAELILDSPQQATLTHGQLTAEVPEQAVGFKIQTPMVEVVDLGTKFGVRVSSKGMTDVAVFSGEVDVFTSPRSENVDSEQAIRVLADEVRRFWNGSTVDEEPLAPPDFTLSIPKRIEIENASFELPRIGGWLSREIAGWKIVSQPAWEGQPNGGVQLASAERVQLPEPANGQQWAFLESCKSEGGVHRTSMYQAVAKLVPNTDYTLRVTIGREGFVPKASSELCYPFSPFAGVEIGLWSGPDKKSGPIEPLKTVRDPLPSLRARSSGVATLAYRTPPELPPGDQWLFIRLGVGANDWCRALFDDVELDAVPVGESQANQNAP